MDPDLITRSLERAAERRADPTPLVYARLFADHPDMEALFVRDTDGSVKGEMLTRVLEAIVDFIGPRLYAAHLIQCEVVTHDGYGVPPQVFRVFFAAVAGAVRELNGDDWTAPVQAAWDELLTDLDHYLTQPDQYAGPDRAEPAFV